VEPERVVIEVVEDVVVDTELMLGLGQLKQQGYRVAVDAYSGEVERTSMLELADYVKIDVNGTSPLMLPGLVQRVHEHGAALVASTSTDAESFERCRQLGFELFQGAHLQRPTVLERRTLSPSQLICVRLLNDLADPRRRSGGSSRWSGATPGLTLRLLRTANSPRCR
jgi:EAL and modified HD-GYP domain-containing signal transduction protein